MTWLGVCDGHDAGAALVDEAGRLVFAVSEGRLTGVKRQPGFPHRAVAACLAAAEGPLRGVAVAERAGRLPFRAFDRLYRRIDPNRGAVGPSARAAAGYARVASGRAAAWEAGASAAVLRSRLRRAGVRAPLELVDHHRCHAWSACPGAGDAVVVTQDAYGDGLSGAVHRYREGRLTRCSATPAGGGPASLFGVVTEAMGFAEGDEGKVVARAAHGDPGPLAELFAAALPDVGPPEVDVGAVVDAVRSSPLDAAAALQARVEAVAVAAVEAALGEGGDELLLAGGLFANVAVNRRVAEAARGRGVRRVFVTPAMGDAGLCVGAAYELASQAGVRPAPLEHAFVGPDAGPRTQEEGPLDRLVRGELVARCVGRLEFGPRALGHRSLLLRPDDPEAARRLNDALGRDPLMPFGPILTAEAAPDLLEGWDPVVADLTRFMTVALPAKDALRALAPAAVHRDGTARAQVLDERTDPALHAALLRLPGSVALNTSLNRHGDPIAAGLPEARRAAAAVGAHLWS